MKLSRKTVNWICTLLGALLLVGAFVLSKNASSVLGIVCTIIAACALAIRLVLSIFDFIKVNISKIIRRKHLRNIENEPPSDTIQVVKNKKCIFPRARQGVTSATETETQQTMGCCALCKVALGDGEGRAIREANKITVYCHPCFVRRLGAYEDVPQGDVTFITCIGGSYEGYDVYYDHGTGKLIGHSYVWHIDDGQEYDGWYDLSLKKVLTCLTFYGFDPQSAKMHLLYEFFGAEVDAVLKELGKTTDENRSEP